MRLVPNDTPAPRLLKNALERRGRPPDDHQDGTGLTTSSNFSSMERAVFAAIVLGAILRCFVIFTHWRQRTAVHPARDDGRPRPVSTSIVAAEPIAMIGADQIHVSAISLGDPPMAIIDGQLVGEGEKSLFIRRGHRPRSRCACEKFPMAKSN